MKKIFVKLVVVLFLVSSVFSEVSFGVRASAGLSFWQLADDTKKALGTETANALAGVTGVAASSSVEDKPVFTGGFSLWANYSFPSCPALGIQGELGMLFNNGIKLSIESKSSGASMTLTDNISYTTVEFPVLITYTVNKGGFFEFIPQAGLYLSIPVGNIKQKINYTCEFAGSKILDEDDTSSDKIDNPFIVGCVSGADFALNFTETSALMLNLRYLVDFNMLKSDNEKIARRTVFLFSAGYRFTLK